MIDTNFKHTQHQHAQKNLHNSEHDEASSTHKINVNPRPSFKLILRRISASLAVFKNGDQLVENNVIIPNETFAGFVHLLHDQKILAIQQTNCIISSHNLRTLLLYIITAKT